jgi:intermembrane space import and assembly protein 40
MQNCFREYPEVYGSELEGDDEDNEDDMPTNAAPASADSTPPSTLSGESSSPRTKSHPEASTADQGQLSSEPSSQPPSAERVSSGRPKLDLVPNSYKPDDAKSPEPVSESEHLVPKAAHDAVEKK